MLAASSNNPELNPLSTLVGLYIISKVGMDKVMYALALGTS
jgi:hypothetical protein